MNEDVLILYDGIDPFFGFSPVPFVSFSKSFERTSSGVLREVDSITLEGQITGKTCDFDSLSGLNKKRVDFLNLFKNNYRDIVIKSGFLGPTYYSGLAKIESIEFEESKFFGILPYTVSLSCYKDFSSSFFGVTDVTDSFEYSVDSNENISLVRTCGAKGINTSNFYNNAIENAENWVLSRRSDTSSISPNFISGLSSSYLFLESSKEEIDRFGSSYKVVDSYLMNPLSQNYLISAPDSVFIKMDFSESASDGTAKATLDGSIVSNGGSSSSALSTFFAKKTLFLSELSSKFSSLFSPALNTANPISEKIVENYENNSVEFSLSYNNNPYNYDEDYSVSIENKIDDFFTVSISYTVKGRGANGLAYAQSRISSVNFFSLANAEYAEFSALPSFSKPALNSKPVSESYSSNELDMTFGYDATWTTKPSLSNSVSDYDYSIEISPPTQHYVFIKTIGGNPSYQTQNMGGKKVGSVSLNGSVVSDSSVVGSKSSSMSALRTLALSLRSQFLTSAYAGSNRVCTTDEITESDTGWQFSASYIGI